MQITILCGESEEDLKVMVGRFVDICRRIDLKVIADKSKDGVRWEGWIGV